MAALSMEKPVDLKRKKWQLNLLNTKRQVLHRCLTVFNRVMGFHMTQERSVKSPRCSETTLAAEIPYDILEEILHRLPVKCLLRVKSVSKEWRSLIESSHIAEKHNRLSHKNGVGVNRGTGEPLRVPGSCNGLVCVYDFVYVYVYNPKTNVIRTLAPPRGTKRAIIPSGGIRAQLSAGFGRDVVTGRYKVVVLYGSGNNDNRVKTKVFDLSTSKWGRRCKTAGPVPLSFTLVNHERVPVFVNGSLFWYLARHNSEILVMDLHTEDFRTVSLPKDIDVSAEYIYMWSHKDRLYVSHLTQLLDSDVWVLVEDKVSERWDKTSFATVDGSFPPLKLNSAWFSPSLVSPYQ
ncbi:unnamed protein product [Microthlaspi erraticum]|uniref:F-box domain-containing protein n=1 Tax=Microthlaspi erraticum TaxID=1685480 RepID=A0A6D2KB27_9BRAS|nr:unnamed protein product [Microthlaspi erraticum]